MSQLTNDLILKGYLKTDSVIDAFSEIQRVEFVPEDYAASADADVPFPIGYGQTISQPSVVAIMLELLAPRSGHAILDVGCGSGWTTGLLSYAVKPSGHVTAVDVLPEMVEKARENVDKYQFVKRGVTEFHVVDGNRGFEKNAPYDGILVSAEVREIPESLKAQLKVGGNMVIPVFNDVWHVRKTSETEFSKEVYSGFSFVPLVTSGGE